MMKILLILLAVFMLSGCAQSSGDVQPTESQQISESVEPSSKIDVDIPAEDISGEKQSKAVAPEEDNTHFEGKIAIVNNDRSADTRWYTALPIIEKYGKSKIVHEEWPMNFMNDQEQMIDVLIKLGRDPEIKAIIINMAVPGTVNAVKKLEETRGDIFMVYCEPYDELSEVVDTADLIIKPDELGMGPAMVQQAYKMGAKTFVHYSFPRHMSQTILSDRRDLIEKECDKLDIKFLDVSIPDPNSGGGIAVSGEFIMDDVSKKVEEYGKDTAFFCTNCSQQIELIKSVVNEGAVYPQPCHPSPNHGFPMALDTYGNEEPESDENLLRTIDGIEKSLLEKDVLNRLSTWPVSAATTETIVATEYAIKWINGEVPKEGIDVEVLTKIMEDYAGVPVYLTPYTDPETGETYENYLMMRMDYITFE